MPSPSNRVVDIQHGEPVNPKLKTVKVKKSGVRTVWPDGPRSPYQEVYNKERTTYGKDHTIGENKRGTKWIMAVPETEYKSTKSQLVKGGSKTAKKEKSKNIRRGLWNTLAGGAMAVLSADWLRSQKY